MNVTHRIAVALLAALLATACVPKANVRDPAPTASPRAHVILIDGTANDETTNTNVLQLHGIVAEHAPEAGLFYVEGPGAKRKVIGMATGWGVGYRVRMAYAHLLRNYQPGDRIYLFGFSRGAYSARILASVLHHAGLPDTASAKADPDDTAKRVFEAFKGDMPSDKRRDRIADALGDKGLASVPVAFMGLWDTVGAMGLPQYEELFDDPNKNYGDQLCNVRRAAHALSLDDDRARAFTPVLLTRSYLLEQCTRDLAGNTWRPEPAAIAERLDTVVDEVWFSGAHADVGGGYEDGKLKGVSMNWMLQHLAAEGLLPAGLAVERKVDDVIHYPSKQFRDMAYRKRYRNLPAFTAGSLYRQGRLTVHPTVLERLRRVSSQTADDAEAMFTLQASPAGLPKRYPFCFSALDPSRYAYSPNSRCLLQEAAPPGDSSRTEEIAL